MGRPQQSARIIQRTTMFNIVETTMNFKYPRLLALSSEAAHLDLVQDEIVMTLVYMDHVMELFQFIFFFGNLQP